MAPRKRRARANRIRGTVWLGVVFAALVGINVYVFFFSSRSVKKVSEAMPAEPSGPELEAAQLLAEGPVPGEVVPPQAIAGRAVDGVVAEGEGLGAVLRREGLTPPEIDEVLRALAPIMNFRKEIRAGQKYQVRYDDQGRVTGFDLRASALVLYQVEPGPDGKLGGHKLPAGNAETRVAELSGVITSTLYGAVKDAGEGTELVAELADLLAYDINFYVDTQDGDRFKVIVEKVYLDGAFYKYGKVLAAEYVGKTVGTVRAFHWQAPGEKTGGYYDEKGQNVAKALLKTPLKFSRVSSGFNPRRMHPILHREKGHFGTDYAAPTGTPVWASAAGKVTWAAPKGGAGNCVMIDHGGGLETTYMHLQRFAKGLRAGQRVDQKQVIGYVGQTGLATGPHLHFSVRQGGKYVDPLKLKPPRQQPVPACWKDAFATDIAARVLALEKLTAVTREVAPAAPSQ